jgi:hypothetical protein
MVFQNVDAWTSYEDIDKGSLWFGDLSDTLSDTEVGILCETHENLNAPWILFEAGALSKGISKNRVCPLLIDLSPADLSPPLSQFNACTTNKDDMLNLVKTINSALGDSSLGSGRLEKIFSK